MVTIHIGKSLRGAKITEKKPKGAVKLGGTSHMTRYARGTTEYLVPKKNVKLVRD